MATEIFYTDEEKQYSIDKLEAIHALSTLIESSLNGMGYSFTSELSKTIDDKLIELVGKL